MANLGRKQLGDWIPLQVVCLNASKFPADPDAAPTLTAYDSAFSVVTGFDDVRLSPRHREAAPGHFSLQLQVDSNFSAGHYTVLYEWTIGAHTGKQVDHFEVVAGGNEKGAYTAVYDFRTPHAQYVVGETDNEKIEWRRNPRT